MKRVLLTAAGLFAGGTAHAAEGVSAMTLFLQGVNLLILIGVIVYFAGKPVRQFFADRHSQVKSDLDAASGVLTDAEARLAEWQAKADGLDAEVEEIKRVARERAETESARILADAETSAERIRADAEAAVDQEVARARGELRAEAATLATELASELLQQNVTDSDQQRLIDEFVSRVERSGGAH